MNIVVIFNNNFIKVKHLPNKQKKKKKSKPSQERKIKNKPEISKRFHDLDQI